MSVVEGIRRMVAAGLSIEDALSIAAEFEAAAPAAETGGATARQLRNRRYYEKRRQDAKTSETVLTPVLKASEKASYSASEQDADLLGPRARVSDKPLIQRKEPLAQKEKIEAPKTPRDFLETVLDPAHAGYVLEHRQRMRMPLTAHAADLLARELAKCPNPNAGADLMISKAWRGFRLAWWEAEQAASGGARASPGGGRMTAAQRTGENLRREIAELQNGEGGEEGRDLHPAHRLLADGRTVER